MTDRPTQEYLDDLARALEASNAPENRAKRERLAELSRQAIDLQANMEALSKELTASDEQVTAAELALKQHLDSKHGIVPASATLEPGAPSAPEPETLEGRSCDDLLDGSITEDHAGRYEARGGVWIKIGEAA